MMIVRRCGAARWVLVLSAMSMVSFVPSVMGQAGRARRTVQVVTDGSFLGIEMEDVTSDNMATYKLNAERGVIVRSVEKDSPAEAAGLQKNDVILEYAGTPALSSAQFARMVRETPVGRKVDLVVSRDGKRMNLSAKIGQRGGGSGWDGEQVEVLPRDDSGRHFEFRMPGPRSFNFHMPDDDSGYFSMPEGGRMFYFNGNEKPRLGVNIQSLTGQLAEFLGVPGRKGALVTAVTEGSPAAGKLKAGDVIVRVEDRSIADAEDLLKAISGKEGQVTLNIVRDKREMSVTVDLPKTDSKPGRGGFRL